MSVEGRRRKWVDRKKKKHAQNIRSRLQNVRSNNNTQVTTRQNAYNRKTVCRYQSKITHNSLGQTNAVPHKAEFMDIQLIPTAQRRIKRMLLRMCPICIHNDIRCSDMTTSNSSCCRDTFHRPTNPPIKYVAEFATEIPKYYNNSSLLITSATGWRG